MSSWECHAKHTVSTQLILSSGTVRDRFFWDPWPLLQCRYLGAVSAFPLQMVLVPVLEPNKKTVAPVSLEVQTCHHSGQQNECYHCCPGTAT